MIELYEGLAALDGMPVPLSHQRNCNLPPPGPAAWIAPQSNVSAGNVSTGGPLALAVSAAACASGVVTRPCTFLESGLGAPNCSCPAALVAAASAAAAGAGGAGGAVGVRRFVFSIDHVIVPQLLVPTGALKALFAINGLSPAPKLEVTEGDLVEVTVTNGMDEESTALAFPGMDLVLTPFAAGVSTVSQCELAPGMTITLRFLAARAGVFLYRGSYHEQDVDGHAGTLIVRPRVGAPAATLPPAAETEFVVQLGEYYIQNVHNVMAAYYSTPASGGVPPVPNALTLNGNLSGTVFFDAGSRASRSILHIVGGHALSVLDVSVDGVALQVFAVDGTPLAAPYLALTHVSVAAGQRVSVLCDFATLPPSAGQAVYLRVRAQTAAYLVPSPATHLNPYELNTIGLAPLNPLLLATVQFGGAPGTLPAYAATGPGVPAAPAAISPVVAVTADRPEVVLTILPSRSSE